MQVSFIIPLYNCLAHTRECLRTLQATLPAGLTHEIIFVDDGSTDGTRDWLAALPAPCRALLNEKNLGFAGACNRGAAAARGEVLVFLNNDLVLLRGWLPPMLRLARRRRAGLIGNVQRHATTGELDHTGICFNRQGKPEHARSWFPSRCLPRWSLPWPLSVRRVPALTGACFAIRRSVWAQLGGFDALFVNGGEDIDLCFRATAAGYRHYVALRSVVRHHVSQSPGRKLRDEENSYHLVLRWRQAFARLAARAWCDVYLERHWEEPRNYADYRVAARIFLYRWHLRPAPPIEAINGVHLALEQEHRHWRELFAHTGRSRG